MAHIRMIQIEATYVGLSCLYLLERTSGTKNDLDMFIYPPRAKCHSKVSLISDLRLHHAN